MRAGDFYTHTFHAYPSTILDPATKKVLPSVLAAREKDVLFDLGHGQGSFSWTVAEKCSQQGFYPDMITTDLHSGNLDGPVYDLATTMSKLLHVGMPLLKVIEAVTLNPAKALRRSDVIGTLTPGKVADVTVLKLADIEGGMTLEDSQGQLRKVGRLLVPKAVWRAGERFEIVDIGKIPNKAKWAELRAPWDQLVVRDDMKPT